MGKLGSMTFWGVRVVAVAGAVLAGPAVADVFSFDAAYSDVSASSFRLFVKGPINAADVPRFQSLLQRKRPSQSLSVSLDSGGGSVEAAMLIGRLIREHEGRVSVDYKEQATCESACVLVFAGGVTRWGGLRGGHTRLGVHRVYFNSLQPGLSVAEVTKVRNAQKAKIEEYLRMMNVSTSLLDLMERFPPDRMHFLSPDEAVSLGLGSVDIAYEERETAEEARRRGVTSADLRRMLVIARQKCPSTSLFDFVDPVVTGIDMECAERRGILPRQR